MAQDASQVVVSLWPVAMIVSLFRPYVSSVRDMFATDERARLTAASTLGATVGSVTLATNFGIVGAAAGGLVGGTLGVVPSLLTFGMSIPAGTMIGSGIGLVAASAAGGATGLVGGGLAGYAAYKNKEFVALIAADESIRLTISSALGAGVGSVTLGTLFSIVGTTVGGAVGLTLGIVPAPFTLGLSIPTGTLIGSTVGLVAFSAAGVPVGMLGGGLTGYGLYSNKEAITEGMNVLTEAVMVNALSLKRLSFGAVSTQYDVIVCGAGLEECILSGLLAASGKQVLHISRTHLHGAERDSLNMATFWQNVELGCNSPENLNRTWDWAADSVPKLLLATGSLAKLLSLMGVAKFVEWQPCGGHYVYQPQTGGFFTGATSFHHVPLSRQEAIDSSLMGVVEKGRFLNFVQFIHNWNDDDANTHSGVDPSSHTMKYVFDKFLLSESTIKLIGRSICLQSDDGYLTRPCGPTVRLCKVYSDSLQQCGGSPFVYPANGFDGLSEGFSRHLSKHGGVCMPSNPVQEVLYDRDGSVHGVRCEHGVARADVVICDPYCVGASRTDWPETPFHSRSVRAICILGAPIPSCTYDQREGSDSAVYVVLPHS